MKYDVRNYRRILEVAVEVLEMVLPLLVLAVEVDSTHLLQQDGQEADRRALTVGIVHGVEQGAVFVHLISCKYFLDVGMRSFCMAGNFGRRLIFFND